MFWKRPLSALSDFPSVYLAPSNNYIVVSSLRCSLGDTDGDRVVCHKGMQSPTPEEGALTQQFYICPRNIQRTPSREFCSWTRLLNWSIFFWAVRASARLRDMEPFQPAPWYLLLGFQAVLRRTAFRHAEELVDFFKKGYDDKELLSV